jgi:hypothetical protein
MSRAYSDAASRARRREYFPVWPPSFSPHRQARLVAAARFEAHDFHMTRSRLPRRMARMQRWMGAVALAAVAFGVAAARAQAGSADSVTLLPPNTSHPASGVRPLVVMAAAPAPYTNVDAPPPANTAAPNPPAGQPDAAGAPAKVPSGAPEVTTQDNDPRALTAFKARLDPYGNWVEDEKYGTVWVPSRKVVGESFAPYVSSGRWALDTGNNWVWVSDFTFGDIVFHYGRWVWTAYGWSWIPGYQYAPAWVTWRTPTANYHYVGWAPAPPSYLWFGGYARPWGYPWSYYWVFCPSAFLFAPYPYGYIVTHPIYIRSIARYTRVYTPASPRLAANPSLESARVPRQVWPSERIAAGPGIAQREPVNAAIRPGASADRANGAARLLPGGREAIPPGRLDERASSVPFTPPARAVPGRVDAPREALPPGRLVPPSRFDAPPRPFLPGNAFRDATAFPAGRSFDAARPYAPSRFDAPIAPPRVGAPSRSPSYPGHVYNPAPGPQFAPHRFDSPARGFSPSFDSSPSFSPRSYSPPAMRQAPAPHMSPPHMRSPRGN